MPEHDQKTVVHLINPLPPPVRHAETAHSGAEENELAVENLEARAQALIGRSNPGKLAAVVHLLEVTVDAVEQDEELSPEVEAAGARSNGWFKHHDGIPTEQVVARSGIIMNQKRVVRSVLEGMILKHEVRRWQSTTSGGGERK